MSWDTFKHALEGIGYVLDTPGALTRGLLSGKPGERATGRQMLESWGAVGPDKPGLDAGDAAGFLADLVVDPLNLVGGGLVKSAATKAAAVKRANAASQAMRKAGAMPAEIVEHLHPSMLENGMPKRVYHGTQEAFDKFDMAKADPHALYGKGIYTTLDPHVASEYTTKAGPYGRVNVAAKAGREKELADAYRTAYETTGLDSQMAQNAVNTLHMPHSRGTEELRRLAGPHVDETFIASKPANVRMHFLDVRNPFNADAVRGLSPEAIRQAGFDAITHEGGASMGNRAHQVMIALHPSQVYSPYVAPALRAVPNIKKRLALMAAYNASRGLR